MKNSGTNGETSWGYNSVINESLIGITVFKPLTGLTHKVNNSVSASCDPNSEASAHLVEPNLPNLRT